MTSDQAGCATKPSRFFPGCGQLTTILSRTVLIQNFDSPQHHQAATPYQVLLPDQHSSKMDRTPDWFSALQHKETHCNALEVATYKITAFVADVLDSPFPLVTVLHVKVSRDPSCGESTRTIAMAAT